MSLPASHLTHRLLPLRAQAQLTNRWLTERLDSLVPELMARENVDLWIVSAEENNEGPLIMTLLPAPSMAARRRTILLFHRQTDGSVTRQTVDRYGFGDLYHRAWDPEIESQDGCLARLVNEWNPTRIGLDMSPTFAFGDGLSHTEYGRIAGALGPELMARTQSAERLAVGWLERRIPPELAAYGSIVDLGHAIIAQAFSNQVIHPGVTTTEDVVWWMRQTMQDLGLRAWFQPTILIQAPGLGWQISATQEERRNLILPGDLLHCDMGFTYLGLTTDHQQHAYVLRPGETDAPVGLKEALADGNRLQEIHMQAMQIGRTGNQVLAAALEQAQAEGIRPSIYSHPLGFHGHAAGPTIGLWDHQDGVPGRGDYELFDDTCYSIELNITRSVAEWGGQDVRIALEEDAALTGSHMQWLAGRQTQFHLILG